MNRYYLALTASGRTMCSCSKLDLQKIHEPGHCPVTAFLFCSICQEHGHATMKCPNKATWHHRTPEFVEQLIPLSVLRHYKIKTRTPIPGENHEHIPYIHDPVIEIPYDKDGKNIRATLAAYNIPSSSVKENERIINALGDLIEKKVSLLNKELDVPNEKPVKTRATPKLVAKK